jgi:hypothetical protein
LSAKQRRGASGPGRLIGGADAAHCWHGQIACNGEAGSRSRRSLAASSPRCSAPSNGRITTSSGSATGMTNARSVEARRIPARPTRCVSNGAKTCHPRSMVAHRRWQSISPRRRSHHLRIRRINWDHAPSLVVVDRAQAGRAGGDRMTPERPRGTLAPRRPMRRAGLSAPAPVSSLTRPRL